MPKKKTTKKKKHIRPTWDEYFLAIMDAVSTRSTCDRGRSACVIVKDKRMIVSGYAGSPAGTPHCDEVGHEYHEVTHSDGTKTKHCIRTTHAEQNALAQAARFGISVEGATAYVNMEPCYVCAKILINAGINRVVCRNRYHGAKKSRAVLKKAKVKLVTLSTKTETYENMS